MKRIFILAFLVTIFTSIAFSQNQVSGVVTLTDSTNQTNDYSGVQVVFERKIPTAYFDTTYTNVGGGYSINLPDGTYNIEFVKNDYDTISIQNQLVYSNIQIDTFDLVHKDPFEIFGNMSGVLKKGTYYATDDIYVGKNETLILEPGVKIYFYSNAGITVIGELKIEGTENERIILTAHKDQWMGINANSVKEVSIKHALIEHTSQSAVSYYSEGNTEKGLKIEHTEFNDNKRGAIVLENSNYRSQNIISNVTIHNSNRRGTLTLSEPKGVVLIDKLIIYDLTKQFDSLYLGATIVFYAKGSINNSIIESSVSYPVFYEDVNVNNSIIIRKKEDGEDVKDISERQVNVVNSIIVGPISTDVSLYMATSRTKFNNNNLYNYGKPICDSCEILGQMVTKNHKGQAADPYMNINEDPMFTDMDNLDFTLLPNSPMIDAGNNDYNSSETDFIGNTRIYDGDMNGTAIIDMGPYEFGSNDCFRKISGKVSASFSVETAGRIYLFDVQSPETYIDSTLIGTFGNFEFNSVCSGEYSLVVRLDDMNNTHPTYLGNYTDMSMMDTISLVQDFQYTGFEIEVQEICNNLIEGQLLAGETSTTGTILLLDQFSEKTAIQTVETDEDGYFELNTCSGSYKLKAFDIDKMDSTYYSSSATFAKAHTLQIDNEDISNIEITLGKELALSDVKNVELPNKVYPNPATETLYISDYSGTIKLINSCGITVLTTETKDMIDISGLQSGIYTLWTSQGSTRVIIK